MNEDQILLVSVIAFIILFFTAIPILIALLRKNPDTRTIAKIAPLAMFSFVLWFALIAWAATDRRNDSVVSKFIDRVEEKNLGPWIIGGLLLVGLGGTALTFL